MKTEKKFKAVFLMLICVFFVSFAQIFYKLGSVRLEFNLISMITNWPIILGLIFYVIALVFMLLAYKYGDLTFLYPMLALTYIFVLILAPVFFENETTGLNNLVGVFLIFLGIIFIGVGSK